MNFRFAPHVLALAMLAPLAAWPQVSLSIRIGPPPLPIYVQPPVPGDGYIWTPGYWSWSESDSDYYWVPGTWVMAPTVGVLWTPGYWGFVGGGYRWNVGYWGPHVGFYGGLNYGYGYTGSGYHGGRWDRGRFQYNRSVTNVNTTIVYNVYNAPVVIKHNAPRVSFNGGPGGAPARATAAQLRERAARHTDPTPHQVEHERTAMTTPTQRASVNHGAPQVAATPRPSDFTAPDVVRAREDSRPARAAKAAMPDKPARGEERKEAADRVQSEAPPAREAQTPAEPKAPSAERKADPAPPRAAKADAPQKPPRAEQKPVAEPTSKKPHAAPQRPDHPAVRGREEADAAPPAAARHEARRGDDERAAPAPPPNERPGQRAQAESKEPPRKEQ